MKVHNFQIEKRMELFNRWVKKEGEEDGDTFDGYFYDGHFYNGGNYIYITPYQLQDPNYIIPEWNITIPSDLRKLYNKIGKLCKIDGDVIGYFAGIVCDYTDFYYRIVLEDKPESVLHSCVGNIEFIN